MWEQMQEQTLCIPPMLADGDKPTHGARVNIHALVFLFLVHNVIGTPGLTAIVLVEDTNKSNDPFIETSQT